MRSILEPAANPTNRSTFGDIGAFYQVRADRPFANELLEVPYSKAAAKNADESTLRLSGWVKEHESLKLPRTLPLSSLDTADKAPRGFATCTLGRQLAARALNEPLDQPATMRLPCTPLITHYPKTPELR